MDWTDYAGQITQDARQECTVRVKARSHRHFSKSFLEPATMTLDLGPLETTERSFMLLRKSVREWSKKYSFTISAQECVRLSLSPSEPSSHPCSSPPPTLPPTHPAPQSLPARPRRSSSSSASTHEQNRTHSHSRPHSPDRTHSHSRPHSPDRYYTKRPHSPEPQDRDPRRRISNGGPSSSRARSPSPPRTVGIPLPRMIREGPSPVWQYVSDNTVDLAWNPGCVFLSSPLLPPPPSSEEYPVYSSSNPFIPAGSTRANPPSSTR